MKRYLFLSLALWGCGSEYAISVAFDNASLASESERFQVAVMSSCASVELGEGPVAPLHVVEFAADESAMGLGALDPGTYGLYARAMNADCEVIAAGCTPITVAAGGEGTLRVILSAASGELCTGSSMCVGGQCMSGVDGGTPDSSSECDDGQLFCDDMCVPSDEANCGACGDTCEFDNGAGVCERGACTLTTCEPNFDNCDGLAENGCESSLQDPATCGDCRVTCDPATAAICSTLTDPNSCVADCGAATQCGGSCVDVQSNALHCGECDSACDLPGATEACAAGECAIDTCDAGRADCDMNAASGCEVDLANDAANCGECGEVCGAGQECRDGSCAGYIDVDVGPSHACGIQVDQTLWCWGRNDSGQASLSAGGSLEAPEQFLVRAATPWVVKEVAVGARHTCAINASDTIECTGDNSLKQIGNRSASGGPTNVGSLVGSFSRREFQQIAAGANHTCALDSVNEAWCWGDNQYGQRAHVGLPTPDGANTVTFSGRFPVALATSDNTSCFLLDDARVHCVGRNDEGQAGRRFASPFESTPSTVRTNDGGVLTNVRTIVAGAESFCAILNTDQLMCWGKNDDSEIDATIDGAVIGAIEVTSAASEAYLFDGTICWRTPVGDGEVSCRGRRRDAAFAGAAEATPTNRDTRLAALDPILDVVAGHSAACGFVDGALTCWGASYEGAIPRASLNIETPTALIERPSVTARGWTGITLSSTGGCGHNGDRRARCWGDGRYGALGNGTQLTAVVPAAVDTPSVNATVSRGEFGTGVLPTTSLWWTGTERAEGLFRADTHLAPRTTSLADPTGFSAAFRHGCALVAREGRREGTVHCWGEGLGLSRPNVIRVGGTLTSDHVADVVRTGEDFSCSLGGGGRVRCWGSNGFGQLGFAGSSSPNAGEVPGVPLGMEQLAVGRHHACASSRANGMYCWGANESGQMGNGEVSGSAPPRRVEEMDAPTSISAGANFTCGVTSGRLFCWGANERHQLGDGTTDAHLSPSIIPLDGTPEVVSAPMGYGSCAAVGDAWHCWGANDFGGLSVSPDGIFNAPTPIAF